jgi:putative DNA primase/helicase
MDDLPSKVMADVEQFKVAITGKNPLLAERKNQPPFSFVPKAGHFYGSNGLVASDDPTDGFYRRWLVLTFNRVFSGTRDDVVDIERKILEERPQIVGMAIRAAAAALQRGSYTFPASHFVAMEAWRGGESVRAFVAECCEILDTPEHGESLESLYLHYQGYAKDAGMRAVNKNNFSQRLFNIGLRKHTKYANVFFLRTNAGKRQADVEDSLAELLGTKGDELAPEEWAAAFRATMPNEPN